MKVMKKLDYIAPEQEVIELKYHETLLAGSAGSEIAGGTDNPEEFAPEFESDEFDIGSELEEYKTEI